MSWRVRLGKYFQVDEELVELCGPMNIWEYEVLGEV